MRCIIHHKAAGALDGREALHKIRNGAEVLAGAVAAHADDASVPHAVQHDINRQGCISQFRLPRVGTPIVASRLMLSHKCFHSPGAGVVASGQDRYKSKRSQVESGP